MGCSRLQAQGLIAGSCVAPKAKRAQGEAHLELLDVLGGGQRAAHGTRRPLRDLKRRKRHTRKAARAVTPLCCLLH